jgi:ABC-type transport system involved in cytochrome c biogenesis permease component
MKRGKKSFLKAAPALVFIAAFLAILIALDIYFIASKKQNGKQTESQASTSSSQSISSILLFF